MAQGPHSLSKTNITLNQLSIEGGATDYVVTSGENGEVIWTNPSTIKTGFRRKLGTFDDPDKDFGISVSRWFEAGAAITSPYNPEKSLVSLYDYFESPTTKFQWSNVTSTACGATSPSDGNANSISISAQSGHTNSAAYRCLQLDTYYTADWFLPSIWQLRAMYKNLASIEWQPSFRYDYNGDTSTVYWSSTEYNASNAWAIDILTGIFSIYAKTTLLKIRPFRIATYGEVFNP